MQRYLYALILVILLVASTIAQPVTWTQMSSPQLPFTMAGSGVLGNYFYCFNHPMTMGSPKRGLAFDLTLELWSTTASSPLGDCFFSSVATDSAIYLIGYLSGGSQFGNEVQKFTPIGGGPHGVWTQLAPYPLQTYAMASAWDGGNYIYTAGGYNGGTGGFAETFRYDLTLNNWTPIASMPSVTWSGGGAFLYGRFYVVGGEYWGNVLYEYNPDNDTWATKTGPPTPVSEAIFCTTCNDSLMFTVGGGGFGGWLSAAVQVYNPLTDTWTQETPLPQSAGYNSARFVPPNKVISSGGDSGYNTTYRGLGFPGSLLSATVSLSPINPPIYIPAGGGSFSYNATINNLAASQATFDVWIMVQVPNTSWIGPMLGPLELTLPGSGILTRLRSQTVPGTAPVGNYWYEARIGDYPDAVWDTSGFIFVKSASGPGDLIGDWTNTGNDFVGGTPSEASASGSGPEGGLRSATPTTVVMPNPFNPSTAISFKLQAASYVSLRVYDTAGRLVATLEDGWRGAGEYQVTFDGAGLPSGVYLARLETGGFSQTQKMVLLK